MGTTLEGVGGAGIGISVQDTHRPTFPVAVLLVPPLLPPPLHDAISTDAMIIVASFQVQPGTLCFKFM
jgi:hypothetical protein